MREIYIYNVHLPSHNLKVFHCEIKATNARVIFRALAITLFSSGPDIVLLADKFNPFFACISIKMQLFMQIFEQWHEP